MPYIGRELDSGNYLKLDDISSSFNGSTTTFNLTAAGKAFFPGSAFSILVNLAGVAQEPESAYQINNATITFATAPVAGDQFFCIVLGVAHGVNVPGNGTVNGAQLAKPFNYDGYFYLDDANNRVGIATATPQKPLHVVGEGQFDSVRVLGDLTVDGTTTTLDTVVTEVDKLEVGANNSTVGVAITQSGSGDILNLFDGSSSVFRVLDGGNVKIGPAGNPGFGAGSGLEVERAGAATIRIEDTSSSSSFEIQNTSGVIKQRLYNNQPWTIEYGSGEKLRITSDGSVGIGLTNPESYGNFADDFVIYNASQPGMTLASGTSGYGSIYFADGTVGNTLSRGQIQYGHSDDYMAFATAATERFRITSAGSVGIGTITPQSQFEVYGTSPIVRSKHSTSQKYTQINHNGTDGYLDWSSGELIFRGASNTERLRITSTGTLDFKTADGVGINFRESGYINIDSDNNDSNRNFSFYDAKGTGSEKRLMILTDTGLVGIGTISSPTGNLEVNGNDGINISNATRTGTNGAQWRLIPHNGGGSATNLRLYEGVGATEVINITKDGRLLLGTTVAPSSANTLLRVHCPISSSSADAIQIGQNTNGADKVAASLGIVVQNGGESTNAADLVFKTASGGSAAERLRITNTTASVASTGVGANGCGVVGINETDPAGDALALAVHAPYGMDDPRPLVYMKRSHGIGGGNGTDETVLHIDGTASYNSAGVIYGIKVNTQHNLNGSHYSGHFVNHGSQYAANGTSAVYVETHKKDTNGGGAVIALHAKGRITTGINNTGYAIAGFFQTGNNINGRPIVCLQEYTANTYTHQIEFRKHNGSSIVSVGSIKSNNSATQYNTSSDYRLKENVVSLTGAIDRLKQLQPKRFNFIGDEETIDGFIAHEVSSTAPYAVSGEKDAVKIELVMDEDGKEQFDENGEIISKEVIDPQGVDYGKLSALTIAALQEALVKIETLEAKVASLEG